MGNRGLTLPADKPHRLTTTLTGRLSDTGGFTFKRTISTQAVDKLATLITLRNTSGDV